MIFTNPINDTWRDEWTLSLIFAFSIPNKYLHQKYTTCVDYQKTSYQILLKSDIKDLPPLFSANYCSPLHPTLLQLHYLV